MTDLPAHIVKVDAHLFESFADGRRTVIFRPASPAPRECHMSGPRIVGGLRPLDEKDLEVLRRRSDEQRDGRPMGRVIHIEESRSASLECAAKLAYARVFH